MKLLLEVHTDLRANDERIGNVVGAAGVEDVLDVRLEEVSAVLEAEDVRPFEDDFVVLDADVGVDLRGLSLAGTEVLAELAEDDAEGGDVVGAVAMNAAGSWSVAGGIKGVCSMMAGTSARAIVGFLMRMRLDLDAREAARLVAPPARGACS